MPKTPDFIPFQRGDRWVVSIPPSMTATGKRVRKVFATEPKAKTYAASVRASHNSGIRGSMISASLALQAAEADRILDGSGITLVEAARMAVTRLRSDESREKFMIRHERATIEMSDVWSDRYRRDMDALPGWVPAWFLAMPCGAIDRPIMERALTELNPLARSTIDNRVRYLSAIIGYRERHRKSSEIAILGTMDRLRLLRACETRQERRAVALLLYAGIRPDAELGEIRRLDWSAVGESEIYVSREVSKVSDRHIPISKKLRREIRGHPKSGPVVPAGWKKTWTRLRKSAGITVNDICRHTFGSMALAAWGEDAAKSSMGHTAGSSTLFRHYRRAVVKADAVRYFR